VDLEMLSELNDGETQSFPVFREKSLQKLVCQFETKQSGSELNFNTKKIIYRKIIHLKLFT